MVAGAAWGRVRALIDDHGQNVKEAGPSTPVQVLGLSEVAQAGDQFVVAPDEKTASRVAETREHWLRLATLGREAHAMSGGAKLEDIFKQIQAGEAATLNMILKADVVGSLEALTESLRKLERDDVKLSFVHRGVGGITQYDVQLAAASNATIIGFNVRPDRKAREMAEAENVEIRNYEIIYQVLEDIENAMVGLLEPEFEEVVTGEASPDRRSLGLLALAHACGLDKHLFPTLDAAMLRHRLAELTQGEWCGQAVRKVVEAENVAMLAAVSGGIVASTAGAVAGT